MMQNLKSPAIPSQETISLLMQQTTQLSYFAFFCLPGFFIVALTAVLPFNFFLQNNKGTENAFLSYIPFTLGCTFLLALLMSLLAVVILFGSGELKKQIAFFVRNPALEGSIYKKLKQLRFLRVLVVLLFICAAGVNIGLSFFIYL